MCVYVYIYIYILSSEEKKQYSEFLAQPFTNPSKREKEISTTHTIEDFLEWKD